MAQAGGVADDIINHHAAILIGIMQEKPMPNSPADPLPMAFWSRKIPLSAGPTNRI
jgi:hypothetical protein